jgi:hypothetical protein
MNCVGLELRLESELIFPRSVVRIGLRDAAEGWVSEACSAAAISDIEVRRVRDVEALCAEPHLYTFLDRKVLEDGEVDMAEVGSKLRVAPGVSNRSECLWSEGCRIEEFSQTLIAYVRILGSGDPALRCRWTALLSSRRFRRRSN